MKVLHLLENFNQILGMAIALLYFYQVVYLAVGLLDRRRERRSRHTAVLHR